MQGAFNGSRWKAFSVFLASVRSFADFACADVSAALRVRTLFGSPAAWEGDGWADRVCTADATLFSVCEVAAIADIVLLPVIGCTIFLRMCDRMGFMLERECECGRYFD